MKQYQFRSSRDPKKLYTTTVLENGAMTCNCPARVQCWHIRRVLDGVVELKVSLEDRTMILALLEEGNDQGAIEAVRDLFPSISEEETIEFLDQLRLEHDDFLDAYSVG